MLMLRKTIGFLVILSVHWVEKIWIMVNFAIGEDSLVLNAKTVNGIELYTINLMNGCSSLIGILAIRYRS